MQMTALMRKLVGIVLIVVGAASLMMMFVFPTRVLWFQMAGVFLILLGVSHLCYPIFRK